MAKSMKLIQFEEDNEFVALEYSDGKYINFLHPDNEKNWGNWDCSESIPVEEIEDFIKILQSILNEINNGDYNGKN